MLSAGIKLAFFVDKGSKERRRGIAVLRITKVAESPSQVTLKLEGRIVSDWVALLERECLTVLQGQRRVFLDCSAVTFISQRGVRMLKRLASEGLHMINASAFLEDLLQGGAGVPL